MQWLLKSNCSLRPSQLLAAYAGLCAISLAVAGFMWWQGARYVLPFASLELVLVGLALAVYAAHAADHERIELRGGRLTIEVCRGARAERVEFDAAWVRVEFEGTGLIALTGAGRRAWMGRHVRPEWRPALADELRAALRLGRGAGRRGTE